MNRFSTISVCATTAFVSFATSAALADSSPAPSPIAPAAFAAAPTAYHLLRTIPVAGDGGWDYFIADTESGRLFISRGTHVVVVDYNSGKIVGDIPGTAGVHGIAIDAKDGRGFTSNGRSNTVTIFDLKTLKKIEDVAVGDGPDCIIFDPATERVFTFNGHGQSATAIDAVTGKVVGAIPLSGKPEFAVADGKGHIYNNIEDKNTVTAINSRTLKVEAVWPLGTGDSPSGIAMDVKTRRLFSVCDNKQMVVLNADTGKVVATPAIGNGPDACAFDPAAKLIFSPNGEDGTMTLIEEVSPSDFKVVGTIPTATGARTMAIDGTTHMVFTISAKMAPAPPAGAAPQGRQRRSYEPNSFVVSVFGP